MATLGVWRQVAGALRGARCVQSAPLQALFKTSILPRQQLFVSSARCASSRKADADGGDLNQPHHGAVNGGSPNIANGPASSAAASNESSRPARLVSIDRRGLLKTGLPPLNQDGDRPAVAPPSVNPNKPPKTPLVDELRVQISVRARACCVCFRCSLMRAMRCCASAAARADHDRAVYERVPIQSSDGLLSAAGGVWPAGRFHYLTRDITDVWGGQGPVLWLAVMGSHARVSCMHAADLAVCIITVLLPSDPGRMVRCNLESAW